VSGGVQNKRIFERWPLYCGVPDLVVTGAGLCAFVDVAVSHPSAPSYAQRASNRYAFAADLRATDKHKKYDANCDRKGMKMVPFSIESYGVLHEEAAEFLTDLAMNADVAVRSALLQHALISLSFALQRGNAIISIKGLSLLRLRTARSQNRHVLLQ
jgi:hypothetical protein